MNIGITRQRRRGCFLKITHSEKHPVPFSASSLPLFSPCCVSSRGEGEGKVCLQLSRRRPARQQSGGLNRLTARESFISMRNVCFPSTLCLPSSIICGRQTAAVSSALTKGCVLCLFVCMCGCVFVNAFTCCVLSAHFCRCISNSTFKSLALCKCFANFDILRIYRVN